MPFITVTRMQTAIFPMNLTAPGFISTNTTATFFIFGWKTPVLAAELGCRSFLFSIPGPRQSRTAFFLIKGNHVANIWIYRRSGETHPSDCGD